jgi:hypothetical protein
MDGPIAAAHRQTESGEKYGPALTYRPFAFKLERYRTIRPDVLLVGSSRVWAFVGEGFSAPMYNAGGSANSLEQAILFTEAALAAHHPRSIILGLDFWWFNPSREEVVDTDTHSDEVVNLSLSHLIAPIRWIVGGQVTASDFLLSLLPFSVQPPGIGVFAQYLDQGWDQHGRFDYGALYDGRLAGLDNNFERTLKRLANAKPDSKFSVRIGPSTEAIATLRSFLDRLRLAGIEVVLFLPPVAPSIRDALVDEPDEILIPIWRAAIHDLDAPILDYHDVSRINSISCEFIDGFHGGEVTYLRILELIAEDKDLSVASAIDRDAVAQLIASNAGNARIRELRPADAPPEIDFLKIGCNKS